MTSIKKMLIDDTRQKLTAPALAERRLGEIASIGGFGDEIPAGVQAAVGPVSPSSGPEDTIVPLAKAGNDEIPFA